MISGVLSIKSSEAQQCASGKAVSQIPVSPPLVALNITRCNNTHGHPISNPRDVMGTFSVYLSIYLVGGLTFLPLLICLILLHGYLTFPTRSSSSSTLPNASSSISRPGDDENSLKSGPNVFPEKFLRGREPDVAAQWFIVCREYVPGGVNGKPPERNTPAGTVVGTRSPSVYQSMYSSLFERNKGSSLDFGKGNEKTAKRARNWFYVVLRHGHLMLYDDKEQVEVRHVISLAHHDVSVYGGGNEIPEGELWIKRHAICLMRKPNLGNITSTSKPFYLFSDNCSDKEDFYFALLQNQEKTTEASDSPPKPQHFEVKHIIGLVQRLHSSEEHLQTRWINGLIGRLFLAMYKTKDIEDFIRNKITKKIARVKKPAFLSGIVLQKIDMGEGAPYITNPKMKDLTVDGDCVAEADFTYTGNFRIEIATTARIDLGSRIKAREVNLVLAVVVKKLEGHALLQLKPPPSNRLWVTFETMPTLEMTIEPIVSSRQITYGFILSQIERRIIEVLAETVVYPNWDDIPFLSTVDQQFRGGIWERNVADSSPSATQVPDQEGEDEAEASIQLGSSSPAPPSFRDERTMSTPDASEQPPTARKASKSTHTLVDTTDTGSSSSVQKYSEPPRMMRAHSFASAANPVVNTDNANVDAAKQETKAKQKRDATTAMIAISNRSQPTSPLATPVGSLPEPSILSQIGESGSFSSTSSKADSIMEQTVTPSTFNNPSQASLPTTPTSIGSNSAKSAFANDTQHQTALQSIARSLTPSEKRQSMPSIGAATAAAKKWGWSVLSRNEQKNTTEYSEREGTPEHPIGRGRPLPPPGQPLPPPERPSTKTAPINVPKRKTLPPPLLPNRRQDETKSRPVPPPPLPARKRVEAASVSDATDEELLVVAAPPDSEPTSPLDDGRKEFIEPVAVNPENEKAGLAKSAKEGSPSSTHTGPFPKRPGRTSSSFGDDEDAYSSWQAAQEEEARSKSVWLGGHGEV